MENNNQQQSGTSGSGTSDKSFIILLVLSIFLGSLGIDRFYLGKIGTGVLKTHYLWRYWCLVAC